MSDRGMKKWAPYKSLQEQWEVLDKISEEQERVERPILSEEQAEEINQVLVEYHGQELEFYYFKRNKILKEKSTIKKIDAFNKLIILNNKVIINIMDLVGIK